MKSKLLKELAAIDVSNPRRLKPGVMLWRLFVVTWRWVRPVAIVSIVAMVGGFLVILSTGDRYRESGLYVLAVLAFGGGTALTLILAIVCVGLIMYAWLRWLGLAGRGYFIAPEDVTDISVADSPPAPSTESVLPEVSIGGKFVCTECYVAFPLQTAPSRSFLGFPIIRCPTCGKDTLYPLKLGSDYRSNYRLRYYVLLLGGLLGFGVSALDALDKQRLSAATILVPGMFTVAILVILTDDDSRRKKVSLAWKKHAENALKAIVAPKANNSTTTPSPPLPNKQQ